MCPTNDGTFYLSESATQQEEYFLKHDHYYGTINTFVNVNAYRKPSKIWPNCVTRILEENQYTTTEETCPSQFSVPDIANNKDADL